MITELKDKTRDLLIVLLCPLLSFPGDGFHISSGTLEVFTDLLKLVAKGSSLLLLLEALDVLIHTNQPIIAQNVLKLRINLSQLLLELVSKQPRKKQTSEEAYHLKQASQSGQ